MKVKVVRSDPGKGPMRFRELLAENGKTYLQCKGCKKVGEPRWAHACRPGGESNWYATIEELEEVTNRPLGTSFTYESSWRKRKK